MRTLSLCVLFVILFCTNQGLGAKMSRCGVANMLLKYGFPRKDLADWVCLIEHESSFRTNVVGPPNTDGSRDYGLFQINSRYWCSGDGPSHNMCRIPCRMLLSNDMTHSIRCAVTVFRKQGLSAWYGWSGHCQGNAPSVENCFRSYNNLYYGK